MSALQETPACNAPPTPAYRRLTQTDLGLILALRAEGKTQAEIAQRLDVTQQCISDALRQLGTDSLDLARHKAKASAYRRVRRLDKWTEKRDSIGLKAAQELNQIAGLTASADAKGVSVGIQVVIGMPGSPAGPDPITLEQGRK